ncbi:hypothetical protein CTE05_32670 [Cellulomonas terrae]|uniref:Uncharacterized protein n=1 Tax=Cellulomonas terrae TaxID=311234 RepID=A0A511JNV9_9CELL|nr:hypothetical protein CTE05_32670 [Cellulomonas terrae]
MRSGAVAGRDTRPGTRFVARLDTLFGIAGPMTIALITSLVPAQPGVRGTAPRHIAVERLFVERLYDVYQHPPTLSRHDRTDV